MALVKHAFNYCNANQVQAAKLPGISRNTLRIFLKRQGLIVGETDLREPT